MFNKHRPPPGSLVKFPIVSSEDEKFCRVHCFSSNRKVGVRGLRSYFKKAILRREEERVPSSSWWGLKPVGEEQRDDGEGTTRTPSVHTHTRLPGSAGQLGTERAFWHHLHARPGAWGALAETAQGSTPLCPALLLISSPKTAI